MDAIVVNRIAHVLGLGWLTGPIFDKEMRVSSRRRRNYLLRFLYIGIFTLLLAMMWADTMPYRSTSAYQSSRMAHAGQIIVCAVLWFEFIAAQAIAVVMLSTSISDEIYHRTLGVLMTTPIGSFQIVIGKLLSKLLQLVLLLAISLPLLAIVRVFGGVPWDFLACGLCVTLTTAVFVGSLSLFLSIFTRRAYSVIIVAIVMLGLLFALLPLLVAYLVYYPKEPSPVFWTVLSCVNPYSVLWAATASLYGARLPIQTVAWATHCGVMLGASGLVLLLAMVLVRKAALRQAMGQTGLWSRRKARGPEKNLATGHVHRVVGPPVLWKECRIPFLSKRRIMNLISTIVVIVGLAVVYVLCYREGILYEGDVQIAFTIIYFAAGMLLTTVLPATCIATEKESRTWPLLLMTSISGWEVLGSKLAGTLFRCLPIWVLLFGHVAWFTVWGPFHPLAILQLGLIVVWVVLFLSTTGLFFSAKLKHTTTSVIANMGLAAGLWAVLPLMLVILTEVSRMDSSVIETYMDMNPFVQAIVVAMATTREGGLGGYEWVQGGLSGATDATGWILLTALIYVAVGLILAAWAGARMRRNPL